jgi:murein DD-endopeptidase MepM/ murein hydrolase activator NlpD
MKRMLWLVLILILLFSGCAPIPEVEPVFIPTITPLPTQPPAPADLPTALPTATETPSPLLQDQPVFLAWPLPAYIGIARISQYPNTPWTWHYLGLNEGYQCPPMFGYLADVSSWPYWRDSSIDETQDMAQADPHNFEMVECYSTDDAPAGSNGHAGTDIKAAADTPVFAAAYGKVREWRESGNNSMVVLKHCLGGPWTEDGLCVDGREWYTTYMHIEPAENIMEANKTITQGMLLGTVYDQDINSHLHFEVGEGERSYLTYENPWGMDESPWTGCMWQDQSLCVLPDDAYQRKLVALNSGEKLLLIEGQTDITIPALQDVVQLKAWGNRIAFLDEVNTLFLINLDQETLQQAADLVQDFQISDTRTAVLDTSGNLYVREEELNSESEGWQLLASDVLGFSISDTRVGYLDHEYRFFVKEGELNQEWVQVAENAEKIQVVDNRLAYVNRQNVLFVNEGEISAEFEQMAEFVDVFEVTNARMGMISNAREFFVKEGNLRAEWVMLGENIQSFQLADVRLLMQDNDGIFFFKECNLCEEWFGVPYADIKMVYLNGEMPVRVK